MLFCFFVFFFFCFRNLGKYKMEWNLHFGIWFLVALSFWVVFFPFSLFFQFFTLFVMDIKRLNNMMSEHGIYSWERLLIPVSNAEILSEATCYVEVDNYAKREVAVLYLEGGPGPKTINSGNISSSSVLQSKKRVVESLRRSLRVVDAATASYYLSIADGDPRAAISQFSQDLKWETNTHLGFA
ncbi:unnamed protein product [Malus baccata var. baccata]